MRPKAQIDHIMKFWCGWCGAEIGEPCRQKSQYFGGSKPMRDFHLARTTAAYPENGIAAPSTCRAGKEKE